MTAFGKHRKELKRAKPSNSGYRSNDVERATVIKKNGPRRARLVNDFSL